MQHKSQIMVNTGDGKGKTTAALGTAFRAAGWGWRVLVIQFIKGTWDTGEKRMAGNAAIPIDFISTGRDCRWLEQNSNDENLECARRGFKLLEDNLNSGKYRLIVLDEINIVLKHNWIKPSELIALLNGRPDDVSVILTGRDAPQEIIDFADQVSVIENRKHPFDFGKHAIKGIDF
jgi:cob(I)alamin adenosyltransferase